MKRFLIIPLIFVSVICWGQKKVVDMPYDNVVHSNDRLYIIDQGTTSKQMRMDTLLNVAQDSIEVLEYQVDTAKVNIRSEIAAGGMGWEKTGARVSLITDTDSLGLGTDIPTEKVDIIGKTRMRAQLWIADTLGLGYGVSYPKIYRAGAYGLYLYFKDQSGTYALSDLASAGSSGNGITVTGSTINLGGTLSDNVDITTTGYTYNVHNTTGGLDNKFYLSGATALMFGSAVGIKGVTSWSLYNDSASFGWVGNRLKFQDFRTGSNIKGLEYYADYSTTLLTNPLSIPDICTSKKAAVDTVDDHKFTRLDSDTLYMDTDKDSYIYSPADDFIGIVTGDECTFSSESGGNYFRTDILRSSDYVNIGNASTHFNRAYIDTIYFDADNDSYIYVAADDDIRFNINNNLRDRWTDGYRYIYSQIYPGTTNVYNLGTTTARWNNLYINSIYIDADNDSRIYTIGDDSIAIAPGGTIGLKTELKSGKITTTAYDTLRIDGDGVFIIGDSTFVDTDFAFGAGGWEEDLSDQTNNAFLFENGDTICSVNDVLISANGDTIKWFGYKIYKNATNDLIFSNGATAMFELDNGGSWFGGTAVNAAVIKASASTTTPTFSWDADDNTGLYRSAADRFVAQAGGNNKMTWDKDSVMMPGFATGDTCVLIKTPTGKIDTAELGLVSDWVFNTDIGKFEDYRIYWTKNHKLKDIQVSGNPYTYLNSITASLEKNFLWDAEVRQEIDSLKAENIELRKRIEALEKR